MRNPTRITVGGIIAVATVSLGLSSTAFGQIFEVNVECRDVLGVCVEIPNPNPVVIPVGAQVQWNFDPSCADFPCSGLCEIAIEPGPGFPGFLDLVRVPGFSNPTPQFQEPGVFLYHLECSPAAVGTIIIGDTGMTLFGTGFCPGIISMTASGATPGNNVFFAYSLSLGSTPVPGCAGVTVQLGNARIAGKAVADSNGDANLSGSVPLGGCGKVLVQAVEPATCLTSNLLSIQ